MKERRREEPMDGFLGRQEQARTPAPAGIHALWTCTDSTRHSLAPFTPALCPLLCVLHCPPEKSSIPGVRALRLVRRDPETSFSVQSRPWPMTRQKCLRIVRAGGHLFHSVLSVFAGIVLRSMRPSWPMERVGADRIAGRLPDNELGIPVARLSFRHSKRSLYLVDSGSGVILLCLSATRRQVTGQAMYSVRM